MAEPVTLTRRLVPLVGLALAACQPQGPDGAPAPPPADAPGAAIQPGRAVWVARAPDGRQLTVTFRAGECSDGMSDLKYPMNAEVVLLNETLRGCAARTAELPREGGGESRPVRP